MLPLDLRPSRCRGHASCPLVRHDTAFVEGVAYRTQARCFTWRAPPLVPCGPFACLPSQTPCLRFGSLAGARRCKMGRDPCKTGCNPFSSHFVHAQVPMLASRKPPSFAYRMPPRGSMLLRRGTEISRYSTRVDRKRQMLDLARGGGASRTDAPLRPHDVVSFPIFMHTSPSLPICSLPFRCEGRHRLSCLGTPFRYHGRATSCWVGPIPIGWVCVCVCVSWGHGGGGCWPGGV